MLKRLFVRLFLILFYFLILIPAGIVFRIYNSDALEVKINPEAESYWKKRDMESGKERYDFQY